MTQEEKQLLIKDLCARLPYGVKFKITETYTKTLHSIGIETGRLIPINLFYKKPEFYLINEFGRLKYKPYLRPLSSMTEEEKEYIKNKFCFEDWYDIFDFFNHYQIDACDAEHFIDWLNANSFDYRGLIEKKLAIKAPDGMYNF